METIVIMTEVKDSLYGRYVKFTIKGNRKVIAEVDRRDGKYYIFGGCHELATRTNKDSAIKYAQGYITGFIPDAKFKWNVMSERIKYN